MDAEDAVTIGQRLLLIRHAKGKSLAVVAELAGIAPSQLRRLESGERAADRRSLIVALAHALQIAPSDLIWRAVCQVGTVKRCPRPSPWTPLRLAGWRGGDVRVGVDASSV